MSRPIRFFLLRQDIEIRPVDIVNGFYLMINLSMIAILYSRVPNWQEAFSGYSVCLLFQTFLMLVQVNSQFSAASKFYQFLRDFYPYILTGFYYPALGNMLGIWFQTPQDLILLDVERLIFGIDPSIVFHQFFNHIFIYEIMHFFYFSFYFFAFVTTSFLYRKKNRELFHRFIFTLMLMITVQFYFFIIWPTAGPKWYYPELQNHLPARGLFSYIMYFLLEHEIPVGAFPSSHVSIAMICCLYLSKLGKKYWVIWIFFTGLLLSTVYTQQHYAIDPIGGVVVALVFFQIGNYVYSRSSHLSLKRRILQVRSNS